jgi:hypothetical protein
MPDGVNETTIVPIPKVNEPETLAPFRPISLCNVIYKLVSKCFVNRLRPMLDGIISEAQSAFVPGRLITDNACLPLSAFIIFNKKRIRRKAIVLINLTFLRRMIG